jgi:hypothetical protein
MDISKEGAGRIALIMYAGQECSVCGHPVTLDDLLGHARCAGYDEAGKMLICHKGCWETVEK